MEMIDKSIVELWSMKKFNFEVQFDWNNIMKFAYELHIRKKDACVF